MALLEVEDLKVYYPVRGGWFRPKRYLRAVDGVSFSLEAGETLGLVGESGCGKSTLGRALVRLENPAAGRVMLDGRDMAALKGRELRRARKNFQMIFQDPYGSLNPRLTIFQALDEVLALHFRLNRAERLERAAALLERVGLTAEALNRYPHQFSGGQRQRNGIARALAAEPAFHRRGRTGFGAGCQCAGVDHQSAGRHPARNPHQLPVHRPRPRGGGAYFVADSGDVPRACGGGGSGA